MKKVLFATTALVLTAGTAMADYTIGGSGRVGLRYSDAGSGKKTQIEYRLRFNIDASKETDSGVTFGGRIRLQSDENKNQGATLSAAYIYATTGGFRVEVGNANTAYDSAALMYNPEIGFVGNSQGDPQGSYFSFDSTGNNGNTNYVAIFAAYSVGDLNVRASYATVNQALSTGLNDEFGISADYKFGAITVSAAYDSNGGGLANNDLVFVGAEYALNDTTNVGLLYNDNGGTTAFNVGTTITLYGNTKLASGVGIGAYVTSIDNSDLAPVNDVVGGIGASYDLGGATLAGMVETRFNGDTYADLGVNFSF